MAVPFSRSLRSLGADRYRGALLGLVTATLLLLAWTLWFFSAGVAIHESSDSVTVTGSDSLEATFSDSVFPRIRVGQQALLRPLDDPSASPVNTLVAHREPANRRHGNRVRLAVLDPRAIPLPRDVDYQARVVVETVSPARLLLRATGMEAQQASPGGRP